MINKPNISPPGTLQSDTDCDVPRIRVKAQRLMYGSVRADRLMNLS